MTPTVIFPKFPCYTQAVERRVKLVTQAATTVCGQNSRDGFIRVRVASQQLMPTFKSKRDFSHFNIHSFGHFYSAPSSPLLLRGAPAYSTDTVSDFYPET